MSVHNHNKRQGGPRWDGVKEKFCAPPIPGHGVGRETADPARKGVGRGEKGGRRFGRGFLYREEPCVPLSSSPDPQEKNTINHSHPRGPSGLKLLRAPSSRAFPPSREAAPARPSPSPGPLRPLRLPRPREGKHKGARSGSGPGPTHPRAPHYCPLAGSAAAATAGVRAAESRRD